MGLALVTKLNAELMHGQFIAVTFKDSWLKLWISAITQ